MAQRGPKDTQTPHSTSYHRHLRKIWLFSITVTIVGKSLQSWKTGAPFLYLHHKAGYQEPTLLSWQRLLLPNHAICSSESEDRILLYPFRLMPKTDPQHSGLLKHAAYYIFTVDKFPRGQRLQALKFRYRLERLEGATAKGSLLRLVTAQQSYAAVSRYRILHS